MFATRISRFDLTPPIRADGVSMSRWCTSVSAKTYGSGECSISMSERLRCRRMRRGCNLFDDTQKTPRNAWRALRGSDETWWERQTTFFDVLRSRAWVMTRRIAHTAHDRGQQL